MTIIEFLKPMLEKLVMSLMVSYFVQSFFPQDVLDEIWVFTESVPEDFSCLPGTLIIYKPIFVH